MAEGDGPPEVVGDGRGVLGRALVPGWFDASGLEAGGGLMGSVLTGVCGAEVTLAGVELADCGVDEQALSMRSTASEALARTALRPCRHEFGFMARA